MVLVVAFAKPQLIAPVAYSAPLVAAAPYATSAVVSREFHGNTGPFVAAVPFAAAYSAPIVAASAYTVL